MFLDYLTVLLSEKRRERERDLRVALVLTSNPGEKSCFNGLSGGALHASCWRSEECGKPILLALLI